MTSPMQKQLKQAQKMMADLMEQQEKLKTEVHEATAGGGMVVARVNGNFEVQSLTIEKDVIDPEDPEMLQDLVQAAVNEAVRKVKESQEQSLSGLTGGMNIPGLF